MQKLTKQFIRASDGAVSIDWVVLTGALVGLAIGLIAVFASSTGTVADQVSNGMSNMEVGAPIAF